MTGLKREILPMVKRERNANFHLPFHWLVGNVKTHQESCSSSTLGVVILNH